MIPAFLAPLILKLSPVGRILKAVPRPVWISLLVIGILLLGTCAHKRSVKKFGEERYAAGVKAEGERIAAKAFLIKSKADAAANKISKALKDQNNEENRAIARSADDRRLRGPGKAVCPGTASMAGGASRPVPASGGPDAAGPEVPSGDVAAVPWGWLVDSAERCDLNRAEVLSWREWHRQQGEAWAKIK